MNSEEFKRLVSLGLTTDQIAAVMEIIAEREAVYASENEARKAKGRERVAKWREARNVTVTAPKVTEPLVRERDTRVSDKLIISKIDIEDKKTAQQDHAEFRSVLKDLDADRMSALIKHRKAKKAQMSALSARLFMKDAEACGLSIAEAVDTCISRNWITVKADWLAKPSNRGSPSPQQNGKPRNIAEASTQLLAELRAANADTESRTSNSRLEQAFPSLAPPVRQFGPE